VTGFSKEDPATLDRSIRIDSTPVFEVACGKPELCSTMPIVTRMIVPTTAYDLQERQQGTEQSD
jgi:hypothetical protein